MDLNQAIGLHFYVYYARSAVREIVRPVIWNERDSDAI